MEKKVDIKKINEKIEKESAFIDLLRSEMNKVIVGQKNMVDKLLIGLLAKGHILLEGVPGLAKTLAINTLSKAISGSFSRIQFTPDLLPADVVGTQLYNVKQSKFSVKKGPVFANFVLADEINRAPAKVQSALLEAMQEKQVTIGEETFKLEEPFLVMATQNPIEQEGTYPLPEAQMDRFLMKMSMGYPNRQEEKAILQRRKLRGKDAHDVEQITSPKKVVAMQKALETVHVDPAIMSYIVELVHRTREDHRVITGASPRASQSLFKTSRASAAIDGRDYVIPDDIKNVALQVVSHRIVLKPESKIRGVTGQHLMRKILSEVPVPVIQ